MSVVINLFIGTFVLFILLWDKRGSFPFGSLVHRGFRSFEWLGLSHSWSMYAPEAPTSTRLLVAGVVLTSGRFEEVHLPYFDGSQDFGSARGLRFITYQLRLLSVRTDPYRPALCEQVLSQWKENREGSETATAVAVSDMDPPEIEASTVAAVELREYEFATPAPGERCDEHGPVVRTVFTMPVNELDR